jgi:hypothetical protein
MGVPREPVKSGVSGVKSAQSGKLDGTGELIQGPRIISVLTTGPN